MGTIIWISFPVAMVAFMALRVAWSWWKYRGPRLITCPENQQPAGVTLDTSRAALHTALRLETCSRWPERQGCGQECLRQIEASPDGCLVRRTLTRWYQGRQCAICGKSIGEINWSDHKPALLSPQGITVGWPDLRTEQVPATLETHAPVCWNCHIMQTFRREHPELAVDRFRPAATR